MNKNTPKVSVTLMTYNQKDYIGSCLESLVTQECNFEFEMVQVIQYESMQIDIVIPLIHEKNLGPSGNFFSILEKTRGDYIAHMDGDDYALPGKLQAQADFMDKTPDCNICFHRVKVLYPNGDSFLD